MNSVILIGRLARDPELSYTANTQTAMCRFTIAVDRPRRQGEDQGADFIRITVWGRQAETCDRYLSKGRQVAVMGRIQTGSYKNREGVTVYTTDVVADRVEFLGSGNGEGTEQRIVSGRKPRYFHRQRAKLWRHDSGHRLQRTTGHIRRFRRHAGYIPGS